ncbi:MAG: hypothetical protein RML36_15270 [Anaerolineae bacterium]|nr:hypothetical protein [Anaerolineae bacterium]
MDSAIDYIWSGAPRQQGVWDMLWQQVPHMGINLVGWPILTYAVQKPLEPVLANQALSPAVRAMLAQVPGAVALMGTSLASTLYEYYRQQAMKPTVQQQLALQKMQELRAMRKAMLKQMLEGSEEQQGLMLG